jgi:translation elongation factor EF-G
MKTYQTDQVKNIVLLGNSGSGKTTLAESMLLEGGVISRKGDVDQKKRSIYWTHRVQMISSGVLSPACVSQM